MSGIWVKSKDGWKTAASQKFGLEKDLHELAEENIHMLPLAGSPNLVVIGSEVSLGSGWADLLAVETTGRPVIIEVKLARNAEAKRAIVAQALSYAAWLRGSRVEELERGPLRGFLQKQGHGSILEAVQAQDQQSEVDADAFVETMQDYLSNGAFRLVLLLDDTSVELERIVAYLDAVTRRAITIDLITVSRFAMGGAEIALPQRVSLGLDASAADSPMKPRGTAQGVLSDGTDAFRASLANVEDEDRKVFRLLLQWADGLADLPGVRLYTYRGVKGNRFTLLPRFTTEKAGLVTIWNDNGKPYVSLWRSVFERRAPHSIAKVEKINGDKIGKGSSATAITDELLAALTDAYREGTTR